MSTPSDYDLLLAEVDATPGSTLVATFLYSDESKGLALKPLFLAAGFTLRKEKPHPAGPSTEAGTYNTYTAGPEAARKLPQLVQLARRNKRELVLASFANPELLAAIGTEISKGPGDILQAHSTNTPTSDHRAAGSSTTPAGSPSGSASAGSSQLPAQPAAGIDTATNTTSNCCGSSSSANAPSSSSNRGGGGASSGARGIAAGFLNRAGSRTAAARDQGTTCTPGAARHSSNSSVCDTGPVVVSDVGGSGRDQDRPAAGSTPKAPATDKTPSSGPSWGPYAMHQVAPAPPILSAPAPGGTEATALLTQLAAMKLTLPPGTTSSSAPQTAGAAGVPPTHSTFAGCGAAQRPPLRRSREHMNMDMNSTAAALLGDAPSREGFTAAGRGSGGSSSSSSSSSSSFSPPGEGSGPGFTVGASGGRGDVGRGSSSSRRRRVKAVRSRSGA